MIRISNHDEPVTARIMTESIIADQRRVIRERVTDVKKRIAPVLLWKVGAFIAIDLLIGQKLLKRAGWVTRLLIPTLLKTFSSSAIENVKKDLQSLFKDKFYYRYSQKRRTTSICNKN